MVEDGFERILPVEEEEEPVVKPKPEEDEIEDLSDMFEVPKSVYKKEDMSDLFEVSEEDIMGEEEEEEGIADLFEAGAEKEEAEEKPGEPHWADEDIRRYEQSLRPPKARKILYRRTAKPYTPPDQIGGMRG